MRANVKESPCMIVQMPQSAGRRLAKCTCSRQPEVTITDPGLGIACAFLWPPATKKGDTMKRTFPLMIGASLVFAASLSFAQSPTPTETQMGDNANAQELRGEDGDVTARQQTYFKSLDRGAKGYLNNDDV